MADLATPSGAAMFDAGGPTEKKQPAFTKPEKPDEEVYKAAVKKAEKEHADVMAKLVSILTLHPANCHRESADTLLTGCCSLPSATRSTSRNPPRKIHLRVNAARI